MNKEGIKVSARPILVLTCFSYFIFYKEQILEGPAIINLSLKYAKCVYLIKTSTTVSLNNQNIELEYWMRYPDDPQCIYVF